jgi:hypothetical protein
MLFRAVIGVVASPLARWLARSPSRCSVGDSLALQQKRLLFRSTASSETSSAAPSQLTERAAP